VSRGRSSRSLGQKSVRVDHGPGRLKSERQGRSVGRGGRGRRPRPPARAIRAPRPGLRTSPGPSGWPATLNPGRFVAAPGRPGHPVGTPPVTAGGVALWPKAFGKVDGWFERPFPKAHWGSMRQIVRYLADLEKRYPGTVSRPSPAGPPSGG
jgi:hypothetical protein